MIYLHVQIYIDSIAFTLHYINNYINIWLEYYATECIIIFKYIYVEMKENIVYFLKQLHLFYSLISKS